MDVLKILKALQGEKSQRQFAAELGVPQPLLCQWYTGERKISAHYARIIVKHYPWLEPEMKDYLFRSGGGGDQDEAAG